MCGGGGGGLIMNKTKINYIPDILTFLLGDIKSHLTILNLIFTKS